MKQRLVVRLYPSATQERACEHVLLVTRRLWNALLGQRRDAWKTRRLKITSKRQYCELTELRKDDPWFASVYRECEDAILHRLDLAYRKFFSGGGHPVAPKALPPTGRVVGIDRGVRVLAATSDGELIPNPRHGAELAKKVARAQRTLERRTVRDARGHVLNGEGKNRARALAALRKVWERLRRVRRGHLHEVARDLVKRYDAIAFERLSLVGMTRSAKGTRDVPGRNVMAKSRLNHAMLDASLAMLRNLVGEKAASAARLVIDVPAAYSSQTCSACGWVAAEARDGERYSCVNVGCGYVGDADVNAACVIAARAFGRPAGRDAGLPDLADLRSALWPGDTRFTRQDVA